MAYSIDALDAKILILYTLSRLRSPIGAETLIELARASSPVTYFDVSEILGSLVESGLCARESELYRITDAGIDVTATLEKTLPFTVRVNAEIAAREYTMRLDRGISIKTSRETRRSGGIVVTMALSDGGDELLTVRLYTAGEERAEDIERRFRERSSRVYDAVLDALIDEPE
ncbi:MAG: DUF4364 family protein [Oscillospiraceae bacterium]|nr:DUF4364 family protein [Oscillospiraceae bacterium]